MSLCSVSRLEVRVLMFLFGSLQEGGRSRRVYELKGGGLRENGASVHRVSASK